MTTLKIQEDGRISAVTRLADGHEYVMATVEPSAMAEVLEQLGYRIAAPRSITPVSEGSAEQAVKALQDAGLEKIGGWLWVRKGHREDGKSLMLMLSYDDITSLLGARGGAS